MVKKEGATQIKRGRLAEQRKVIDVARSACFAAKADWRTFLNPYAIMQPVCSERRNQGRNKEFEESKAVERMCLARGCASETAGPTSQKCTTGRYPPVDLAPLT